MCLYPKLILNRKYLPSKKNIERGYIPECKDERTRYVAVGCGNCIECRKQKAQAWRIRLQEEIKVQKYKYFVTLTFSNENLIKLMNEMKCEECNAIAGRAIRLFLERWRKKYKVSLRHWLITELGHENTERIHLHGIIFNDTKITNEELEKIWSYGYTDTGKYCNSKSINYIIKYVTKIDKDHKQYKPEIFCSAGLGKTFVMDEFNKSVYKYRPHKTTEYYRLNNGQKISIPIYYRNHFFTEEERELIWRDRLDKNTIYVMGIKCDKLDTEKGRNIYDKVLREQRKLNTLLGYGNDSKEWKEKDYNITLKMLNKRTEP